MDKIRYRDLQRWSYADLEQVLPIAVTHDSQTKLVILSVEQYNKLVKDYKKTSTHDSHTEPSVRKETAQKAMSLAGRDSKPSIPLYNPLVHRSGDTVLIRQGKRLVRAVVPELDADKHFIPNY